MKEKQELKGKKIGFAVTGSFCTFESILPIMKALSADNTVIPIFSNAVYSTDTRFFKAADFYKRCQEICGRAPICSIVDAEPIGPKKLLDMLLIAPCTGNTLAKLALSVTDTPVLMAAKAHLRNDLPTVLAVSSNDALSGSAKNIGMLLNNKNIYFVPMKQDDPQNKPRSLIADYGSVMKSLTAAIDGRQLQPIYY